jgi:hypothetical protein
MSTILVALRHRCFEGAGFLQVLGMQHTDYSLEAAKKSEWALGVSLQKDDAGLVPVADTVVVAAEAARVVLLVAAPRLRPCKTEHY